jgi:hypothetical protein
MPGVNPPIPSLYETLRPIFCNGTWRKKSPGKNPPFGKVGKNPPFGEAEKQSSEKSPHEFCILIAV